MQAFHAVWFACLDLPGNRGPILGARVVASEKDVLAVEDYGTDRARNRVAVDLDAAVRHPSGVAKAQPPVLPARLRHGRSNRQVGMIMCRLAAPQPVPQAALPVSVDQAAKGRMSLRCCPMSRLG